MSLMHGKGSYVWSGGRRDHTGTILIQGRGEREKKTRNSLASPLAYIASDYRKGFCLMSFILPCCYDMEERVRRRKRRMLFGSSSGSLEKHNKSGEKKREKKPGLFLFFPSLCLYLYTLCAVV